MISRCEVPARYRTKVDRQGEEAETMQLLREYAQPGSGALILLCGQPGTGKSHMVGELILEGCRQGRSGLYVTSEEMLESIKATFGSDGNKGLELRNRYAKLGLLVINEWGREHPTEWARTQLWHIINKRYEGLVPTIIVSNQTPKQLRESLGPSLWSRMLEEGGILECNWRSHREKKP